MPKQESRSSIIKLILADYDVAGMSWAVIDDPVSRYSISQWLPSSTFSLLRIAAEDVAAPSLPHTPARLKYYSVQQAEELLSIHIVVDKNVHEVGKAPNMDFVPGIIVVSGASLFHEASENGQHSILAYVGDLVMEELLS
ncbi:hypothetical protein LCGC14_2696610 [marine sediment metagenome]|uniref:Uncharacterized protein n=1 Tax=marine sediment metagenome TaxID=412755 RepID=A0A0F9A4H5_9ZZZZ